jgi:hypothetical protein
MTDETAPAEQPRIARKITQDKIRQARGAFTLYSVQPYPGTTVEDVIKPDYWKHVAHNFKADDEIRMVPEDQSWRAHLYVTHAQHGEMFVQVLSHNNLSAMDPALLQTEEYEVKWRGVKKFSVVRKKDNAVIKEDIATKEQAVAEMASHVRAIRR